jgi:signal peptidase II
MSTRVQVAIVTLIVVADQIVKALVRSRLALHESVTVIPGFFDLTRVHNTGAAYGFLDAVDFPFKTVLLACVAVAALVGLGVYATRLDQSQPLTRLGLTLVMGGALGNLIDRVSAGYVLDFVDLYSGNWHFWAFNVADSAITIGVVLMVLELLGLGRVRVSRAL